MSDRAGADASSGRYDRASWALFGLLLVVVAVTFVDYGITIDEPLQSRYGGLILEYDVALLKGGFDARALEYRNLYLYGGLFDTLAALLEYGLSSPRYETRHALNALVGVLGVLGCWKLARALGGPRAAFWAALLLVLTPRYYGHMFNNPKDIPFAVGYVWSVYYLVQAVPRLPRLPRGLVVKLGAAIGLTLGVRIGGLLLIGYLGLVMGVWAVQQIRRGQWQWQSSGRMAASFLVVAGIAYLVMLACWPWAQGDPLGRPFAALSEMTHFVIYVPVLFAGQQIFASDLPRSYIVHMLLITMPEIVLLLIAFGVGWAAVVFARCRKSLASANAAGVLLVTFAVAFPIAYVVAVHSLLYDGIRQLLFVVPPLTCLAALVLCAVTRGAARRSPVLGAAVSALVAVSLLTQLTQMLRLHPYETVYYNRAVGGLAGAYGRYETDYWGNSYREAARKLVAYLKAESDPETPPVQHVGFCRIPVKTRPVQARYYFPSWLKPAEGAGEADFFMSTTRWNCDEYVQGEVIVRVERLGVPLAIVKDLRRLSEDLR